MTNNATYKLTNFKAFLISKIWFTTSSQLLTSSDQKMFWHYELVFRGREENP